MQLAQETKTRRRRHGSGRTAPAAPSFERSISFRGIFAAAKNLGVTPYWLRRVLKGESRSRPLIEDCLRRFPAIIPPETLALYDGISPQ